MPIDAKEPRTAVLGIRVTESERIAANLVAGARGLDVSTLLRQMALEDVLTEAERLRGLLLSAA
jgi:Mg-chelatase subunit ChlI